jgi:hypothetical protein
MISRLIQPHPRRLIICFYGRFPGSNIYILYSCASAPDFHRIPYFSRSYRDTVKIKELNPKIISSHSIPNTFNKYSLINHIYFGFNFVIPLNKICNFIIKILHFFPLMNKFLTIYSLKFNLLY